MKKDSLSLTGTRLARKIEKFFASDVWDLRKCPTSAGAYFGLSNSDRTLDFSTIRESVLKQQVKDHIQYMLIDGYTAYKMSSSLPSELYRKWSRGIEFLSVVDYEYKDIMRDFDALNEKFVEYAKVHFPHAVCPNRTGSFYVTLNLLSAVRNYIAEKNDSLHESIWDRDRWFRDQLPLDRTQINLTSGPISISFDFSKDPQDKAMLKRFVRHLIEDRRISFSTLTSYHNSLRIYVEWLQKQNMTFANATRENVENFYAYLIDELKISRSTFDCRVSNIFATYEYLQMLDYVKNNPVYYQDRFKDRYHYRLASVDDETIVQIFGVLHMINPMLVNMFLLVFSTGMRVSEACLVRNNCLVKNERGYYIRYYCQKMKKDVMNVISHALYIRLEKAIEANAKLTWNEEYLFWRAPNTPYYSAAFRQKFQDEMIKYHITNPDGSQYLFRPHDLRHTIATKLYKAGSSIAVIQKVLHHVSVEMSLAYIECDNDYMKSQHAKYLNYRGEAIPLESDTERLQWLRNNISAQSLPNGLCALPVSMGKCPHCNACLDGCPYFQTSVEFIDIHKKHLEGIEQYIEQCVQQKWTKQLECAQRVRDNLTAIIGRLQE